MRYLNYFVFLMTVAAAAPGSAAPPEDVRAISLPPAENKIIDEKCLGCHNRHKIDAALKQRKNMDKVMRQMEEKGVTLTDADREVLGHFWQQNPLKK
ncbi:hypothetical protein [Geotalea sp. SG265]|uniref:hypothetical protein n=1 Tax=Geotalea sp. SG265 TaxID=2922867 RepID=UPI001FAFF25A|nr:hypothetical protein [Geotalea sp. SG265]